MSQPVDPEVRQDEEVFCYRHPDRPTRLRCSRCERPICGACATPAVVGQHCPECVAEARRTTPRVKSAMAATAPAVMTIIAINVIVFFIQFAQESVGPDTLTGRFSMVPVFVANGEWWRLITATFLHAPNSIIHILFNMMVLYFYGPAVEQAFGTARFVAMYLVAGFVASAVSYALGPCGVFGVGASGAIFGVVGILLAFLNNRKRSQFVAEHLRSLTGFVVLNLIIGFVIPNIDWRAHIGGLAAGGLMGLGVDSRAGRTSLPFQIAVIVGVGALGVALVAYRTSTFSC